MRVSYRTFGCKANQYDTEQMRQAVEAVGGETVTADGDPTVWVVNTCTVTNQADADARRFVRRLQREHPSSKVIVAGCSAALKEATYRAMPGVTDVVPGHGAQAVAQSALGARGLDGSNSTPLVQITVGKPLEHNDFEPIGAALLQRRLGRTRGWLKVQDGCDRKCSFCATRLARGASRSRTTDAVVAEAVMLAEHHPEIVITGIHIGHYGHDLNGQNATSLSRLVTRLLEALPETRFRLGSIEATEVDDRLIELLSDPGGKLAPHLHMPLQSGADSVLRNMRRWHTREAYRKRAFTIARAVPVLGLGADVITGFPGEEPQDHASTRALIDELPFTYLHVFPYSPRDDTVARSLPDPVPQRVAGERARDLRELGQQKATEYVNRRVGDRVSVVVEGGNTGLTEDYLRVEVRTPGVEADELRAPAPWVRATLQHDARGPYIEDVRGASASLTLPA